MLGREVRHHTDCEIVRLPRSRRLVMDVVRIGRKRNAMRGLLDVDVTRAREMLRAHRDRFGVKPSLTAFIIWCVARAIEKDRMVQAFLDWRNRLVIFDDVDVQTTVEALVDGEVRVVPHIIRAANRIGYRAIHDELRHAKSRPKSNRRLVRFAGWFQWLPWFLRRPFYWYVQKRPRLLRRHIGTTIVSSVGMFVGSGGGWAIGTGNLATFGALLGGIVRKPGVVGDRIEPRDYLALSVAFNHDVLDGAPATRFTRRLVELIEKADGLREELDRWAAEADRERPS